MFEQFSRNIKDNHYIYLELPKFLLSEMCRYHMQLVLVVLFTKVVFSQIFKLQNFMNFDYLTKPSPKEVILQQM